MREHGTLGANPGRLCSPGQLTTSILYESEGQGQRSAAATKEHGIMNEPTITCPRCEAEFPLTETLARPYIDAERAKIEQAVHERSAAIDKREAELRARSAGRISRLRA